MDHIASRRLTAIMRQPRRLTDRIWKSVSPELLKLMDKAKKSLLVGKKKDVFYPIFKTFHAAYKEEHDDVPPWFNFGDLLEIPSIEAALEDMSTEILPETLVPGLEQELPVILEERAQKLRSECIANVNKQREELCLLAFDSIRAQGENGAHPSPNKVSDVSATDCPLLTASTVFTVCLTEVYGTPYSHRDLTFTAVIEKYLNFPYPENVRSMCQPLPWRVPAFQPTYAQDAEAILEQLGLPFNVTLAYMEGVASSIQCKACPRLRTTSWTGWVEHQDTHRTNDTKAAFQYKNLEDKP